MSRMLIHRQLKVSRMLIRRQLKVSRMLIRRQLKVSRMLIRHVNSKLWENTPPFGRRVSTQFLVFPISTRVDITVYQHGKCFIFVKYQTYINNCEKAMRTYPVDKLRVFYACLDLA